VRASATVSLTVAAGDFIYRTAKTLTFSSQSMRETWSTSHQSLNLLA
jgi:hypothetical protein